MILNTYIREKIRIMKKMFILEKNYSIYQK